MNRPLATWTRHNRLAQITNEVELFRLGEQPLGSRGEISDDAQFFLVYRFPQGPDPAPPVGPPVSPDPQLDPEPPAPPRPVKRTIADEVKELLEEAEKARQDGGSVALEEWFRSAIGQREKDHLTRAIDHAKGSRWQWMLRPPARFAQWIECRDQADPASSN